MRNDLRGWTVKWKLILELLKSQLMKAQLPNWKIYKTSNKNIKSYFTNNFSCTSRLHAVHLPQKSIHVAMI